MVNTAKNLLIIPNNLLQMHALKTASKRVIQKATGDLIGNKNADRSMNFSKTSQESNSETIKKHDK